MITDFGLAVEGSGRAIGGRGSATYMVRVVIFYLHIHVICSYQAPEVYHGKQFDYSADMWSCGVVVFILLFGSPLFEDQASGTGLEDPCTLQSSYSLSVPSRVSFEELKARRDRDGLGAISEGALEFIASLLTVPGQRLTAAQALEHHWIKSHTHGSLEVQNKWLSGCHAITLCVCVRKPSLTYASSTIGGNSKPPSTRCCSCLASPCFTHSQFLGDCHE